MAVICALCVLAPGIAAAQSSYLSTLLDTDYWRAALASKEAYVLNQKKLEEHCQDIGRLTAMHTQSRAQGQTIYDRCLSEERQQQESIDQLLQPFESRQMPKRYAPDRYRYGPDRYSREVERLEDEVERLEERREHYRRQFQRDNAERLQRSIERWQ
jgi:predicted RNase H-like nuclease (RuvC/YqgF family)